MKDLLAGMLVLVALWQYVAWIDRRRRWHYAIALLSMMLGMLCKPTAVVTPLLAVVIDVTLIGRSPRAALRALWPMFVLAVPCVLWTRAAQPPSLGAHVPLWQRPIVACDALAFYLWKIAWPNRLGMDYGRAPGATLSQWWVGITWIVPALVGAALWFLRDRVRPLASGALVAVGAVLPVLGLAQFEFQTRSTVADHYLYLPMFGVALAAAWAVQRFQSRRAVFYTCAVVLAALGLRTLDQTRYWKDSRALFAHAIEVNPNSFSASQNLAVLDGYDAEMLEAKAQVLRDGHDAPAAERADVEARARLAESEQLLANVLTIKPGDPFALHTRATLHAQFKEHREAIIDLQTLLDELPTLRSDERDAFVGDYDLLGQEWLRVHEPVRAIGCFDEMLKLRPQDRGATAGKQKALAMLQKPLAASQ